MNTSNGLRFQADAPSQLGSEKTSIGTISTPSLRRGLLFSWSWHPWLSSKALMARTGNKKAFTVHLSDEMAAMIDLKRKEWGLRSRGEVIERLLGWMVEPT